MRMQILWTVHNFDLNVPILMIILLEQRNKHMQKKDSLIVNRAVIKQKHQLQKDENKI